eukprot:11860284-Ditylum_brightwellii.AAC.1
MVDGYNAKTSWSGFQENHFMAYLDINLLVCLWNGCIHNGQTNFSNNVGLISIMGDYQFGIDYGATCLGVGMVDVFLV